MKVQEAKDVCKDRSKWKEGSLPTPMGNGRDVMYACKEHYLQVSSYFLTCKRQLALTYVLVTSEMKNEKF
jgi:hypothetical protein